MALQALQAMLFFQAFGVYAPFWMADFGWSRTTISLIHSMHRTESGLLGPIHGWLLTRYSPRNVVIAGMVLLGGGFVVLGFVQGLAQFVIVFLIMSIGASLCGFLSLMTVVVNWFARFRSRAMALIGLGMSIGGLLVPLLAWLLVTYGWRPVAIGSGVVYLLLAWPLSRTLITDPESVGLLPDGRQPDDEAVSAANAPATAETPLSAREALRSSEFWLLSIGHSNALAIVGAVSVHFVIYVRETLGLGVTVAASLFTLITVCQIAGQAVGGFLGDRFDKRWLAAGGMAMHVAAMVILIWAGSVASVVAASVLHGFAWGLRGPLMSAMRADYFGRRAFAMVMGYSSLILMVGSVIGPLLIGIVADSTGAYGLAFGLLAGIGAIGGLAFLVLPKPGRWLRGAA
ncbi:MAG: MFS transporter [Trueperaceae bacterium]|nr:MFS transporter [Trueperaceae bacterium]